MEQGDIISYIDMCRHEGASLQRGMNYHLQSWLRAPEPDATPSLPTSAQTRVIPSHVKAEVWKRDRGQCVLWGQRDNLHFDHEIPFSKGGASVIAQNIRLLCARQNLSKGARIE